MKRAYSDEAKQEREDQIIAAAESLLIEKGYHAINMDQVARAAGLAKGTVYLYFKTKEDVFLKVFERQGGLWGDEIEQALVTIEPTHEPAQSRLIELLVHSLVSRPLFTRLVALSPIIFEYNIPPEQLRVNKLWVYDNLRRLGDRIDEVFHLRSTGGAQLLLRLFIVVAGLEGFAHPSPIAKEIYDTEPSLPKIDFETELRTLLTLLLQ
ncbi:MAG: hypothetical protein BroJett018_34370 [Chloroflexota bacterium]|nr:TetR family transcriptional regulator [Chloroflexota bacterium]GIK65643.1 MAG: hypothetical protein BroJett018_34370 [Chloroflexota bacterium]